MNTAQTFAISALGDRDILMTRSFDAPRELVWEAYTKPELVTQWLGVRGGWTFPICEMDVRPGGKYRWVWRGPDGSEMGVSGVYREVAAPERIVATEQFDDPWYEGEGLTTVEFLEKGGVTQLSMTVTYQSEKTRDEVLDGPMKGGVEESFSMLADLLKSLQS